MFNSVSYLGLAETDKMWSSCRSDDHIAVLTQMYASVWMKVLPYCLANTITMLFIYYFDVTDFNISLSDRGHVFMSIMVSFLIVTRSRVSLERYMEARRLLGDIMRVCRELVEHTTAFTRGRMEEEDTEWRVDIAKRTSSLLRTVAIVLTRKKDVWQISELTKIEKQEIIAEVRGSDQKAPMILTLFLRSAIASHCQNLSTPLDCVEELCLLSFTSDFVTAYHGMMTLIDTPFPFPLVQMTRTVLFLWIFTLPFALANDIDGLLPLLFVNFFCTYGFIGLELTSIEIGEPFGSLVNSFPVEALSEVVISDISVMMRDIDGPRVAMDVNTNNNGTAHTKPARRYRRQGTLGPIKDVMQCPPLSKVDIFTESLLSLDCSEEDSFATEDSHIDLRPDRNTYYGAVPKVKVRKSELDCTLSVGESESLSESSYDSSHGDISFSADNYIALETSHRKITKPNAYNFTPMKSPSRSKNANGAQTKENLNSSIIKSLHSDDSNDLDEFFSFDSQT